MRSMRLTQVRRCRRCLSSSLVPTRAVALRFAAAAAAAAVLPFVVACSASPAPSVAKPPAVASVAPPLVARDAVGIWSLTDDENTTFDVRLTPDGRASSNWSKGPAGAGGESGRWSIEGPRIVVSYTDGWTDVIVSTGDGRFLKESFAPSANRQGPPTNRGQSVRTPVELSKWVGVYRLDGAMRLAVQSSSVAWRTSAGSPLMVGSWWIEGDRIWIRWADGALEGLRVVDASKGTFELGSWGSGPSPTATPSARRAATQEPT